MSLIGQGKALTSVARRTLAECAVVHCSRRLHEPGVHASLISDVI